MSNLDSTVLAGVLERKIRNEQLAPQITNSNYQGELGAETSVKVGVAQAGNVQDYTGGQVTIQSNVDATPRTLAPEHRKFFSFSLDGDTNIAQFADGFANETFAELLEEADKYILGNAVDASNTDTYNEADPVRDLFSGARTTLTSQGVPQAERYAVVPESTGALVYDEIASRGTERGDAQLQVGMIGRYYGFEVYERPTAWFANSGTTPTALFGSRFYSTYADAVVSIQIIEDVAGLPGGIVVQGLHVAGEIKTQPDGFVAVDITQAYHVAPTEIPL